MPEIQAPASAVRKLTADPVAEVDAGGGLVVKPKALEHRKKEDW